MTEISQVFHVCHELDLLEANIVEASHYAEKIYIKEAPIYWTGLPKPLYVKDNWKRFSKYKGVELIIIPESEYQTDFSVDDYRSARQTHRFNRDKTRTYGWDRVRDDVDYVIESDVDELIDHKRFYLLDKLLSSGEDYLHVSIRYENRLRYMNRKLKRHDEYRVFKASEPLMHLYLRGRKRTSLRDYIGWHFSSCFLSPEGLREKAIGGCHEYGWFGVDTIQPIEEFERMYKEEINMTTGQNKETKLGGFTDRDVDLDDYPIFVKENPNLFPWGK